MCLQVFVIIMVAGLLFGSGVGGGASTKEVSSAVAMESSHTVEPFAAAMTACVSVSMSMTMSAAVTASTSAGAARAPAVRWHELNPSF